MNFRIGLMLAKPPESEEDELAAMVRADREAVETARQAL